MKKNAKNFPIVPRSFVQLFSLMLLMIFCVPVITNAQGGKANFSGTWALNADKSSMGDNGGRRMGGGDFVATQEANLLTVVSTRTNRDGESMTITRKYTLDGKESTNTMGRGESKSTAKWSADGKSLTIETVMSFNGNERKSSEVWTLKDSKTLSINSTRQGRDGEVKMTLVYDKK
jgi:hypothetical protein